MKFALYIDALVFFTNTSYTKTLLVEKFAQKNHVMDIYYPYSMFRIENNLQMIKKLPKNVVKFLGKKIKTENLFINPKKIDDIKKLCETIKDVNVIYKTIKDKYIEGENVKLKKLGYANDIGAKYIDGFPSSYKYDVLIVTDTYSKRWLKSSPEKKKDMREQLINSFRSHGKKFLCIRDSPHIEYRFLSNGVHHGICSEEIFNMAGFNYKMASYFKMPLLSNLAFDKPNMLSKEEFFKKYNLDMNKKLLCIIPGKSKKWTDNEVEINNDLANINKNIIIDNIYYFYKNLDKIYEIATEQNYTIICKLHTRTIELPEEHMWRDYVTYIDNEDACEFVRYSDKCISFATTMVYQLYLYDLPTFDIGTGVYYLNWYKTIHNFFNVLSKYKHGKDLIYGKIATNFKVSGLEEFKEFLTTKYNIKKFKYLKNNPIYGDSYDSSIENVRDCILNALNTS